MNDLLISIFTQALTFLPLAFAISVSYHILRATDMTLDGSFVIGAAIFARLVTLGVSPFIAAIIALLGGLCAGVMVACFQRGGKIDPLLAGVLASFMMSSINLIVMGKPNINLLTQTTLVSNYFNSSELAGWSAVAIVVAVLCTFGILVIKSRIGLTLRALGDNQDLLQRLGKNVEFYRMLGFGFTNLLAAGAGCITAQTVGYADVGMGFGMTLTGIGAIILGQQVIQRLKPKLLFRTSIEFIACCIGITVYYFCVNVLLRFNLDPLYLKLVLGLFLITFIRLAIKPAQGRVS